MNYGYDHGTPGWKEDKKGILAKRLCEELPANLGWTPGGVTPYIEVDNLYSGVRIRKITHLAEEDVKNFLERADKIYHEVMTNE